MILLDTIAQHGRGTSWFAILCVALIVVFLVRLAIPRRSTYAGQCDMCGAENPHIAKFCRQCGQRVR
ncbi:MAG TPA: zinc-ribbon domain-containing protein [Tepidisphaeraceae bacterium]|jgi:rRNA maturation endonuclease Nob1|nr:zinc-ribbon domain-containing protein [Tepidisphaeraceae bacterium]